MIKQRSTQAYADVLRRTARMLSGLLDEPGIIRTLLDQVTFLLPSEKALALVRGREGDRLLLSGAIGLSDPFLEAAPRHLFGSSINQRALAGELVIIEDLSLEPELRELLAYEPQLKGMVAVPLTVREHVIGALHVYLDSAELQWPEDLTLLCTMSDLGGLALERLRHHQSLYRIAQVLNSSLDLTTILRGVLDATVREMWLKAGSIRILGKKGKRLRLVASHGLSTAYTGKGEVHVEKSEIDRRVLRGESVMLHDVLNDPGYEYPEAAAREGIQSVLAVPLKLNGRVFGVMRVYSAQPHRFCAVSMQFLSSVADLVSLAIENAQLHAALQARCRDMEVDLAEWHRFLALG